MNTTRETLQLALDDLLHYQEIVDSEWGDCRTNAQIQAEGKTNPVITAIQAELAKPPSEADLLPGWVRAADAEMICAHLGVANLSDSYESANAKLKALIDWHVAVATDPAVNGGLSLQPTIEPLSDEVVMQLYNWHSMYQEEGPEISGWFKFARAVEAAVIARMK